MSPPMINSDVFRFIVQIKIYFSNKKKNSFILHKNLKVFNSNQLINQFQFKRAPDEIPMSVSISISQMCRLHPYRVDLFVMIAMLLN